MLYIGSHTAHQRAYTRLVHSRMGGIQAIFFRQISSSLKTIFFELQRLMSAELRTN